MKFNNVDVIISQRLASVVPMNKILYMGRVSDADGIEVTTNNLIKIIRAFIIDKKVIEEGDMPAQLMDSLKEFMDKKEEEVLVADIEKLFSVFRYYEYSIKVIGRLDLNEGEVELGTDDQIAYVIDNFRFNDTGTSGFYSGYAKMYSYQETPLAMDFIGIFGLNKSDMDSYDLMDISSQSYEIFKNEGRLNTFDDSNARSFIESRGMKFIIERFI